VNTEIQRRNISNERWKNTTKDFKTLQANTRCIAQSSAPNDESGVNLETVGSESWVFEKLSGEGVG
jgi:hypothetical protein